MLAKSYKIDCYMCDPGSGFHHTHPDIKIHRKSILLVKPTDFTEKRSFKEYSRGSSMPDSFKKEKPTLAGGHTDKSCNPTF